MAALPPCSLCRTPEKIRTYLDTNKQPFLTYSIFFILLIEWYSAFYIYTNPSSSINTKNEYLQFWYPMLSQLALFIVFFSLFLWKERLRFCYRKSAVCFYLSSYYFLGFLGVLFCLNANVYYILINYGTIAIASFLFIASVYNKLE